MVVSDFLSFHVSPDPGGADPGAQLGSKALRGRGVPAHGGAAAAARRGPPGRGQVPGAAPGCGTPAGARGLLGEPAQRIAVISVNSSRRRAGGAGDAAHLVRPPRCPGIQCSPPEQPPGAGGLGIYGIYGPTASLGLFLRPCPGPHGPAAGSGRGGGRGR